MSITVCGAPIHSTSSSSGKGRQSRVPSSGGAYPKSKPYLRFAELVNGRSAMQGVAWASVEAATHGVHTFDTVDAVIATGLVAAGTTFTFIGDEDIEWGPFTTEAELKNGRGAMLAMAAWFAARASGVI